MDVQRLAIPDVVVMTPRVFGDHRGFFMETFRDSFFKRNIVDLAFVQDNHSRSTKGILRGLHYQLKQAQGKLVRVISGQVFDVAVDIRKTSATFGQWVGETLSEENRKMLWVPPGFAHGFYVLSDIAEFVYKCTDYYTPEYERSIRWDDPDIGIQWPLLQGSPPVLSEKDDKAGRFKKRPGVPMKVLIIGAGGQLGWELQQTRPENIDVQAVDFPEIDLSDPSSTRHCITETRVDWIINAAAYTAVDQAESDRGAAFRINHDAVSDIATLADEKKIRLAHISTDYVFSGKHYKPLQPDDPIDPKSVYGMSKWQGEEAVREILKDDSLIIRTAWLYSSHGKNFVNTMLNLMAAGKDLNVIDEQVGTPTWARGLAKAVWGVHRQIPFRHLSLDRRRRCLLVRFCRGHPGRRSCHGAYRASGHHHPGGFYPVSHKGLKGHIIASWTKNPFGRPQK